MSRFIKRDVLNRITGDAARPQDGWQNEELADDNPELVAYQTNGVIKTAAELDAAKDEQVAGYAGLILKVAFNHENRIRQLENKVPITLVQFAAALKAFL